MKRKLLWIVGIIVVLAVIGAVAGHGGKKKQDTKAAAATVTHTATKAAPKKAAPKPKAVAAKPKPVAKKPAPDPNVDPTMNARTKAFVAGLHVCDQATSLAAEILKQTPTDLVADSAAVNTAKETCSEIRDRMATMDEKHFTDQAVDGEIAVDYWTKGLGRVSDYIDGQLPSDAAKAIEYFGDARSQATVALAEINVRRKIYGFGPLK